MYTTIEEPPTTGAGDVEQMTAIVQHEYGDDPHEVLQLAATPVPTITDDEVLVRVHASSVDRGTWHVMAGVPYPMRVAGFGVRRPKSTNPGRNLAGTVERVGTAVTDLRVGDEVYGVGADTFAELAAAPVAKLAPKPANLSFREAAAVPVSGLTALQAVLDHGQVTAGQRVLILGASGGVGSFAVQLAKAQGAEVTGVASTRHLDAIVRLGADDVLDHTAGDVLATGATYDVIVDLAGNRPLGALRRALTPTGRLVIVGGEAPGRWIGGNDRQLRAQVLSLFVRQHLGTFIAKERATDLERLRHLIEGGQVTPLIGRTYPLAATADAISDLVRGAVTGKAVIDVGAD